MLYTKAWYAGRMINSKRKDYVPRKVEIRSVFKNLALKPGLKGFLGGPRLKSEDDMQFLSQRNRGQIVCELE